MSIFESLVLDSWSQLFLRKHSGNRSGFKMRLSQRKLNCALSVDFLWKKRLQIGQTLDARKRIQVMKVRSFPLHGGTQTFGSLTVTDSFLTESLILAQNERWRRG